MKRMKKEKDDTVPGAGGGIAPSALVCASYVRAVVTPFCGVFQIKNVKGS